MHTKSTFIIIQLLDIIVLDKLYEKLLPMFSKWVKETPLWRRICSKMILTVHDNALESVIIPLLKWTEW